MSSVREKAEGMIEHGGWVRESVCVASMSLVRVTK